MYAVVCTSCYCVAVVCVYCIVCTCTSHERGVCVAVSLTLACIKMQLNGKTDGCSPHTSQTTASSSGQLATSMEMLRKTKVLSDNFETL